jgi:hypothetical protein
MNELRYTEEYDIVLKKFLQKEYYSEQFTKGWYIKELVKTKENDWIIQWEKSFRDKTEPQESPKSDRVAVQKDIQ